MKRNILILVALFSLVCSSLMAWDLDRQCDFPANFYGIEVVGNDVWAVGTGGAVAHSTDNGESYSFVPTPAFNAELAEYIGVSGVSFKDVSNGVVCGEDGFAAITSDNGATWTELTEVNTLMGGDLIEQALYQTSGKIWFVGVDGKVVYSSDNGASWELQTTGISQWIYGISMDDAGTGYISGNNGSDDLAFIMKTTDFGTNWVRLTSPIAGNPHLYDVKHNGEVVVISGEDGYVGLSTDGGTSFSTISVASVTDDMRFVTMSGDEGYVVGWHGAVIRTEDNWATVAEVETPFSDYFEEVKFDSNGDLVAAGWRGNILKSTDNGMNWVEKTVPATYLLGGSIIDDNNWYICGDYAYFLKTTDGGDTYEKIYIPGVTDKLYDTWFFNQDVGIVSGDTDGIIYRTEDGAETWTAIEVTGAGRIYKFHFMNDLFGFAFAASNKCLKTTDGGLTWEVLANGPTSSVYSGFVKDEMNIIAGGTGSSGNMWTTTDGGANWIRFGIGIKKVKSIAFKDENIGVAVTEDGFIYYTTTGGMTEESWTAADQVTTEDVNGVTINDDNNFVACAYSQSTSNIAPNNVILVSEDNGITWSEEVVPATTFNPIRPNGIMHANGRTVVYGGYQIIYTDYDPILTETPEVFFSEYIEGSSNNKALEIYNGTDAEVSLANFRINQSNNGGDWAYLHEFPIDAVIAAGDVWVMAADQLDPALFPLENVDELLAYPSVCHFNGNDARALEYSADGTNWEIIDVIGIPTSDVNWAVAGIDPGTQNHTIVRKESVVEGNIDWNASAGTNADDSEWIVYDENTFSYLGSHNAPIIEGTLSGTVTLADGAGVITEVIITAGTNTVSPAADGTYSIVLTTGTYELTATLEGYVSFTQADVVITEGAVTTVDIALSLAEEMDPPTNPEVNQYTAEFTWTAPGAGGVAGLEEGFETWPPAGWIFTDADGDGYQWDDGGALGLDGHTGLGLAYSASYDNTAGALNPDNWIISPAVTVGANANVNYWVAAQDNAWAGEHYGVYVSTTGTDVADFELVFEETMVARTGAKAIEPRGTRVQGTWYERNVDLSAYSGDIYVAFRHFNVTDMFYLDLDDVTISSGAATRELTGYEVFLDGASVANVTDTNYTFTGLTYDQEYVAGVRAVYTDGTSEMVTNAFTYTEELDLDTPSNLSADEVTGNLTWTAPGAGGVAGLEEGFETWPPAGWIFTDADADGYQWDDGGALGLDGHTGLGLAYSASYDNTAGALNPDNWLISPAVTVGANANVTYWVAAQDDAWAGEHYGVYVSTTGTDVADFELVFEETMVGRAGATAVEPRGSRVQGTWYERNVDLSAYTGDIYVAFRHFNVTDMFYLDLDDVTISSGATRDLTRDLTGYEVFLDGASVASVTETNHTLTGLVTGTTYEAGVTAVYDNGSSEMITVSFTYTPTSGEENNVTAVTALGRNYPNPFNPTTNISFSLKEAGNVTLEVYNAKGQKIKTLVNGEMAADNHVVTWNGDDNNGKKVSSGIYFYKMHSKKYSETKKMLMIK